MAGVTGLYKTAAQAIQPKSLPTLPSLDKPKSLQSGPSFLDEMNTVGHTMDTMLITPGKETEKVAQNHTIAGGDLGDSAMSIDQTIRGLEITKAALDKLSQSLTELTTRVVQG